MTTVKTFKFAIQTGNLPEAIASTAVAYTADNKKDIKALDATYRLSYRLSFIGYKITEKMKAKANDGDTFPANFAVSVPDVGFDDLTNHQAFCLSLLRDYQDTMLHAVADGESKINPADLTALSADYFDRSRAKNAITKADVQKWLDESFTPAMMARMTQNNTAVGVKAKSAEDMAKIAFVYETHIINLMGRTVDKIPGLVTQISIRQWVEKLIEVDLLAKDEISDAILARITTLAKTAIEVIEDAV